LKWYNGIEEGYWSGCSKGVGIDRGAVDEDAWGKSRVVDDHLEVGGTLVSAPRYTNPINSIL